MPTRDTKLPPKGVPCQGERIGALARTHVPSPMYLISNLPGRQIQECYMHLGNHAGKRCHCSWYYNYYYY